MMITPIPTSVRPGISFMSRIMTLRAIAIMATVNTTSAWTTCSIAYALIVVNNSIPIPISPYLPLISFKLFNICPTNI